MKSLILRNLALEEAYRQASLRLDPLGRQHVGVSEFVVGGAEVADFDEAFLRECARAVVDRAGAGVGAARAVGGGLVMGCGNPDSRLERISSTLTLGARAGGGDRRVGRAAAKQLIKIGDCVGEPLPECDRRVPV